MYVSLKSVCGYINMLFPLKKYSGQAIILYQKEKYGWTYMDGGKQMVIDREDMLELTRRMTVKRNSFTRIAGCYINKDGGNEGTFNTHFLDLAADKERLGESEEVYNYIICVICPLSGSFEPGEPECGFLFPAFTGRSSDIHHIAVYNADAENPHTELVTGILKI